MRICIAPSWRRGPPWCDGRPGAGLGHGASTPGRPGTRATGPTWSGGSDECGRKRPRTDDEDRERCVVQWSADFADADRAQAHAERLADPWFGVNYSCNAGLGADARRLCDTGDMAARCRRLDVL